MDMKKHSIAFAVVMVALVALASASSWEGSAMMGSYGDFPSSGYYAACNSFPRNTSVDVVNLENGRTITVIVTRGLESSGVFMMLSVEAAGALGLQPGRVARIRASEPRSAVELAPSSSSSSSFDPDLNPRLMAAQELKRLGYDLEPATPATAQKPAAETQPAPIAPIAPVATAATPVAPAATPETTITAPETTAATPVPAAVPSRPSAIALDVPPAASARAGTVAVAEPAPLGKENPEPLAGLKPKPVRTIVLPQLPEPSEPVAKAAPAPVAPVAAAVPETKPEAVSMLLPVPDETPLRVLPSSAPKRYEAPSVRPEVSSVGLRAPRAPELAVALADPVSVADSRAAAFARSAPERYAETVAADLSEPASPGVESASALARTAPELSTYPGDFAPTDPSLPASGRIDAIARTAPRLAPEGAGPELAWPELEADEIPEVVLALLAAPAPEIPATSLAEGEIILPAVEGPSALALETPEYGAAETVVALEDAEAEAEEKPTAETPAGVSPYAEAGSYDLAEAEARPDEKPAADAIAGTAPVDSGSATALAEAAEQKPETAPYVDSPAGKPAPVVALDSPGEYIVAMEPTGPKPPAGVPAVTPTTVAPAAAVAPPAVAAPASVPSAAVVTSVLEKGRFYIQIGAFGNEAVAKDSAGRLGAGYTVVIQKTSSKGKDTWRVYVGPLSRDESGVALVRVRAMGYKDAFVKGGS